MSVWINGRRISPNAWIMRKTQSRLSWCYSKLDPSFLHTTLTASHSMYYHTVMMTIYGSIKTAAPPDGPEAKVASLSSANRICQSSAHAVGKLMEVHENNWGFELMNFTNMRWIATALYTLMDDLSDTAGHTAFRELCMPAISMAKRWLIVRGMLRLVRIQAKLRGKTIPEDIRRALNDFERRYWRPEDQQQFRSCYPDFAASIREQDDHLPEDLELDKFLEKWRSVATI